MDYDKNDEAVEAQPPGTAPAASGGPSLGRRNAIKATLAIAPFVLTVRSRPAWAGSGASRAANYGTRAHGG